VWSTYLGEWGSGLGRGDLRTALGEDVAERRRLYYLVLGGDPGVEGWGCGLGSCHRVTGSQHLT